jgi:hypothetical protein
VQVVVHRCVRSLFVTASVPHKPSFFPLEIRRLGHFKVQESSQGTDRLVVRVHSCIPIPHNSWVDAAERIVTRIARSPMCRTTIS